MASVEITDNTIIRSLVRKGTNDERRQITLEEGELGYTTDTKRLFIGDGIGTGVTAGTKYLGALSELPASLSPQPGDFFTWNGGLYARKTTVGQDENLGNIDLGYDKLGLAANPNEGLAISSGNLNVLVDDSTITINTENKLQVDTLTYNNLPTSESYNLLGNPDGTTAAPSEIQVSENSILGRIASSNIQSVTFDQVLTNASNPTVSNLTITGLTGSTTRSLFVNSSGQITTSTGSGTGSPLYVVSIDQSGTIHYDYNIDTVTPYNDLTTALTEFNISYIGSPATTGNGQYISEDPGGFLANSASIVTNGSSNLGIYKIVFDSPHPDYTGQMIHEASSTNFMPSRYTGNKWMTSNQPTLNLFWENSSTIWLYVSVPIFSNVNKNAKGYLTGQILSAGTPDSRTRFQVKIY